LAKPRRLERGCLAKHLPGAFHRLLFVWGYRQASMAACKIVAHGIQFIIVSKPRGGVLDNGELHLFILWQTARAAERRIVADLAHEFEIVDCCEVTWSRANIDENLSRFYRFDSSAAFAKRAECGGGPFLLITVWDPEPHYEQAITSRGHEIVNAKMLSLKDKYRSWAGGGCKVHATNSIREADRDLTLLLGMNCGDYLRAIGGRWDGKIKRIDRDLVGANGWESLKQLFYVMNSTIDYAVLRNHEPLPSICLRLGRAWRYRSDCRRIFGQRSHLELAARLQKQDSCPF
jgi:hypothetical protein